MSGRNKRVVRNRDKNSNLEFNKNILKIVIPIICILIIVLIVCININLVKSKEIHSDLINEKNEFPYEYFPLTSEENVGVVDKTGKVIIQTKYDEIEIPNPEKDVFICYKDNDIKILNKNDNEIFTNFKNLSSIKSTGENNQIEQLVLKYENNGLYGLVDLDGNVISDAIYEEISSLNGRLGRLLTKKDGKYGIIDSNSNVIVDFKYDSIQADEYCSQKDLYEKTGYIASIKEKDGQNFGYIDYLGNKILDIKYELVKRALEYEDENTYLIAMQHGKKGVFKNKKKIIDLNFQDINYSAFSNVFIVNKNGKYGIYNTEGKVILKPEYKKYSIAGNYISVEKDDEKSLFDINGNLVKSTSYTKMIETTNPAYFIAEDNDGYYSIISKDVTINNKYLQIAYAFDSYFIFSDENGKAGVIDAKNNDVVIDSIYDFIILIEGTKSLQAVDGVKNIIDIYSNEMEKTVSMEGGIVETLDNGYSIVYSESEMEYIDSNGNVVKNIVVYPNSKLYAFQENGKWGFVNRDSKTIVKCEYDIVTELNEYGFAGIKKDGKWGVIDENGDVIVEPIYELDTYYFPKFIGKYLLNGSEIIHCEEIKGEE